MSPHILTPIREDEVEGTMSASVATPVLKEDADINITVVANATAPPGEDEVKTSNSANTTVPVRKKEEVERGTIIMGCFFQVPSIAWHSKLEMMSKPGLTQGEYERQVLAQGYVDYFASRPRHPHFLYHHNFASSSLCLRDEHLHFFFVLQPYPVHVY